MEDIMRRVLSMALLIGLVSGAEDKNDSGKKDKDLLKGTWIIVSLERDGKKNEDAAGEKVTFDGESITIQMKERELKGTYKLDSTKKPKQIEITPADGPDKDKALHGIYSIEKNELKICIAHGEKERPTEFKSEEGSGISLATLKRMEPR
jgi:uncharacterized protein (TIGR03067 family)